MLTDGAAQRLWARVPCMKTMFALYSERNALLRPRANYAREIKKYISH